MDVEFLGAIGLGATLFSAIVSSIWFYRKRLVGRGQDIRMVAIEFSSPEGVEKETVRKIIIYFENLDAPTPVVDINGEAQVIA